MQSLLDDDSVKLEVIRFRNDGVPYKKIEEITGVSKSAASRFISKETYKEWWDEQTKPLAAGELFDHHHKVRELEGTRFIITSAQNSTFVHSNFLKALEVMAEHIGAQIIVGTYSYNTNGFQRLQKSEGEWFDPKITKYIIDEPVRLAKGLMYCGELNILPTAVDPLSGFHSYTKSDSGILPHAKIRMESLPVFKGQEPKFLYTTGTVTQRNYIQKKAGQKASFHHVFGALVVEVDNEGEWFCRQIIADTESGEFYDLDTLYTADGWSVGHTVEAINWGDIHAERCDMSAISASFINKDSMLDVLRPKYQLVHDVLDMTARNHHNINDPYFRYEAYIKDKDFVKDDIWEVINVLSYMERAFSKTVVVESNHDQALRKWLRTADYKTDPANAIFFLEMQLEIYRNIGTGRRFSVLEHAVKTMSPSLEDVTFLGVDESFLICPEMGGIECGMHGHIGVGGSRGSAMSFAKLSSRTNVGHSHSSKIIDGCYQAGTLSSMDLGYNQGPSTWSASNIVTYKNSKRTIVTIKNGKWRA